MNSDANASHDDRADFSSETPARVLVGRAGTRPLTTTWLKFRVDHALARDAICGELDEDFIQKFAVVKRIPSVKSSVCSRDEFIQFPPTARKNCRRANVGSTEKPMLVRKMMFKLWISDGLSAKAVEKNAGNLLPMIVDGLKMNNISPGLPVVVQYWRVAVGDQIAFALSARVVINLIGERPGLSSAEGFRLISPTIRHLEQSAPIVPSSPIFTSAVRLQ